ncbi:MAG: PfkB family carbohydrate kinase [Thermotogota bacterium]|nr:PfkB family carbohydrate kinase [Thermotogota bacterium]
MGKIIIAGELLFDMITHEYCDSLSESKSFDKFYGGSPGNLTSHIKDLGMYPIIISRLGNDSLGRSYRERLESKGITTKYIQMDEVHHTSFVLICKSKGSPEFLPLREADYYLELPQDFDQIIKKAEFFHTTTWPLSRKPARANLLKMIEIARRSDVKVSLEPNYREILWERGHNGKQFIQDLLKDLYLVKPSLDDAYHIFGEGVPDKQIERFHEHGVNNVILTLGKEGSIISDGKQTEKLESVAKKVIDTTGAGDAFWAGTFYGLIKGKTIFESAKIGNIVSAYRIEHKKDKPLPNIEKIVKTYGLEGEACE